LYSTKEEVIRKLYEEAERRLKNDQVGVATFSFGGFEQRALEEWFNLLVVLK
jgi:hypothetical protein